MRGAMAVKDWSDSLIFLMHKTHAFLSVRELKFQKVRYDKKPNPVTLERDDATLIHKVSFGHKPILPNQIAVHIKGVFKGNV